MQPVAVPPREGARDMTIASVSFMDCHPGLPHADQTEYRLLRFGLVPLHNVDSSSLAALTATLVSMLQSVRQLKRERLDHGMVNGKQACLNDYWRGIIPIGSNRLWGKGKKGRSEKRGKQKFKNAFLFFVPVQRS